MVVRLARSLERDARQRRKTNREGWRENRVAFDDAGIAAGGLLADTGAIDQRHTQVTLGEVQRYRGADDTGSEHHGVRASHELSIRALHGAFIWNGYCAGAMTIAKHCSGALIDGDFDGGARK